MDPDNSESSNVDIGGGVIVKRKQGRNKRRPVHINKSKETGTIDDEVDKSERREELLVKSRSSEERGKNDTFAAASHRQWEHQSHPADVIVHSFGMNLVELIEGLIIGTTAVITPSVYDVESKPITVKDIDDGLGKINDTKWKLDDECYAYKEAESDHVIFYFKAPNLNSLMHKILEVGAITLYGTCDYLLISKVVVHSFLYSSEDSNQVIDLRDNTCTLESLKTPSNDYTQWGESVCLKSEEKSTGIFEIKLKLFGDKFSHELHEAGTEIKAITRHCSRVVCHVSEEENCLTGSDEEADWIWHAYMLVDI